MNSIPSYRRQICAGLLALATLLFSGVQAGALEGAIDVHDPSTGAVCNGNNYVFGTGTILQSSTNAVETARYLVHDNQKWTLTPVGGFCKIASGAGANVLTARGEATTVEPFIGADNQLWKIDQLTDGSHRIASKLGKFALTATFKTKPGNGIALEKFTGDDAQRWAIAAP